MTFVERSNLSKICFSILLVLLVSCGGNDRSDHFNQVSPSVQAAPPIINSNTLILSAVRSNYRIVMKANDLEIIDTVGSDGQILVDSKIQSLVFKDISINLSILKKSSEISSIDLRSILELYIAYFNRVPDANGLSYWIDQIKAGASIESIGESFYSAALLYPAETGYTENLSHIEFVTKIYTNVLGRSIPDTEGLNYWSNALATKKETRGTLIRTMLNSARTFKGHAIYGWVTELLENRVEIAYDFAVKRGISYVSDTDSVANGISIASAVSSTDISVASGLIDSIISGATYTVSVITRKEDPSKTCVISKSLLSTANTITCKVNQYRLGGIISGLTETGLVLQNSFGEKVDISANGPFAFNTPINSGAAYSVLVITQPSSQANRCIVENGIGTIRASDVSDIKVSCTTVNAVVGKSFPGSSVFTFDADGAVGLNHFAEISNNGLRVIKLSDGVETYSVSLRQFWVEKVGLPLLAGSVFDPHLEYDHASGRWFAISLTKFQSATSSDSSIFLGISDTNDPSAGWHGVAIQADPAGLVWADYPYLGLDTSAIYIKYGVVPYSSTTYIGQTILAIPKNDLVNGQPFSTNLTRLTFDLSGVPTSTGSFNLHPASQPQIDYGGTVSDGLFLGFGSTRLVPQSTGSYWDFNFFQFHKMSSQSSGTKLMTAAIPIVAARFDSPINPRPDPHVYAEFGRQPSTDITLGWNLGNNHIRVKDAHYSVKRTWVYGYAGITWMRLQPSTNTIVDGGYIGDENSDYIDASIAANINGDVVIAYTRTSSNNFASFYCSVGRPNSKGKLVFGEPILLKAGIDIYDDKGPRYSGKSARFSDYSSSVSVHPANPKHFWVSGAFVSGRNKASTWISEVIIP